MSVDDRPLRICYVLSHFYPRQSGAERQALAQGRELIRRGHSVRVVTRAIDGLPRDDEVDGVLIHRWVRTREVGPLFGLSFVAGVISALRRLRPQYDLIHTHQGLWESISTGLGRDLFKGAPILVQPASSGYFGEAEEMARTRGFAALRRLSMRNPAFAAISADIEAQWSALGVPPSKMIRMASGVDADHFHPGASAVDAHLPSGPKVVFTGRLHPQKNLDLLLDIWPGVVAATGARLVLVGQGPERERLENKARELAIGEYVVFTGGVADPAEYLRAGDAFALPSVAEGMSNSLLEAMATGLPCLASEIGGNTDLLGGSPTRGVLVPPNDKAAWEAALVKVLSDQSYAAALGQAARESIDREYSIVAVVDRYVELYRRMLGREWPE